ncbi:YceI family protein [Kribbella sp. CA-253562]|uniref:YceI family protein n=1 Tax=Kribbella sp. CA-253562 TaxID=3239942 RepID=UPI003D949AFA
MSDIEDIAERSHELLTRLSGDYELETQLGFTVAQAVAGRVRGRFERVEGTARLDGDDPSQSSVQLTIRTDSIRTGNKRRDQHLCRSFLDTAGHPLATFSSTRVTRLEESAFRVAGLLTLRGVTKPVTLDLELASGLRFHGETTIDRRDWQVVWNAPAEAWGLFVGYDVTVQVDVVATRRPRQAPSGPVVAGFETKGQ